MLGKFPVLPMGAQVCGGIRHLFGKTLVGDRLLSVQFFRFIQLC